MLRREKRTASLHRREIEYFIMVRTDRRDGWWATPKRWTDTGL